MNRRVLVRGGGDLASGTVARLHRVGFGVLVVELPKPLVVRRKVSFAEAVFQGMTQVEEIRARQVATIEEARLAQEEGVVPVLVDPELASLAAYAPAVLVDGRMRKSPPEIGMDAAELVIGLGPGFTAGVDCHAVVETIRGHDMGRVIWEGQATPNTGVPEAVLNQQGERVLRAPAGGELGVKAEIGEIIEAGNVIAAVGGKEVRAPFRGALRGLLYDGLQVTQGMKIGDLDPRAEPRLCFTISDKALAVGGGVLEVVFHRGG
jgi:xanthine dehydrogenase accessory factor